MSESDGVVAPSRRIVLRSLLRSFLTSVALIVLYYQLPLRGDFSDSAILLLPLGLLGFGYLTWHGVHGVISSETPRVRAIQVLATAVPFFIVLMATTYYLMAIHDPQAFNVPLTRTDSLYFTVTAFSTVGFGDIVPLSEGARIVAMIQMIGDLIVIGAGVHVLTSAVRLNVERRRDAGKDDPLPDELDQL